MKLISLNLAGRKDDIKSRIAKIANFLDTERAGLVCLQEVTFMGQGNLAEQINDSMQNKYQYLVADLAENFTDKHGRPQSDGLAILANEKIIKHENLILEKVPIDERGRPDFHKRIVQLVELSNGLKIANLHLASNANSYLQLREALVKIPKDYSLIGDFNIHKAKMLEQKPYWNNDYQCSIEFKNYISFPSENCTFDYLLLSQNLKFIRVRTASGLSDHYAIIYELK